MTSVSPFGRDAYSAELRVDNHPFASKTGNDLDQLECWMHAKAQGMFGNISGSVLDRATQQSIRCFRMAPMEC